MNRPQSSNQNKNSNAFADLLGPMAFTSSSPKPLSSIQSQSKSSQILNKNPSNQISSKSESNSSFVSQSSANLHQKAGNSISLDLLSKPNASLSVQPQLQSNSNATLLQSIPVRNTKNDSNVDPFANLQALGFQSDSKSQQKNELRNATHQINLTSASSRNLAANFVKSEPACEVKNSSALINAFESNCESQADNVQSNAKGKISQTPDIFDLEFLGNSNKIPAASEVAEDDILGLLSLPVASSVKPVIINLPQTINMPKKLDSDFERHMEKLLSMGFEPNLAATTLLENNENLQATINQLVANEVKQPIHKLEMNIDPVENEALESLRSMGFTHEEAEDALFSTHGDLDKSVELLVGKKRETQKQGAVFNASNIVGAIGMSVLKNAKSAFNASKQKVGKVLNEVNSGGILSANDSNDLDAEDWKKTTFKDSTISKCDGPAKEIASKPLSLTVEALNERSDSVEVPLQRIKKSQPVTTQQIVPLLSFEDNEITLQRPSNLPTVQSLKNPLVQSSVVNVAASSDQIDQTNKIRAVGNEYFKKGQFGDAEIEYTKAIAILPPKHSLLLPLYNNRAACRIKNGDNRGAVADCDVILEQDSTDLKALLRRATAFEALENWECARNDYRKLMGIDPNVKGVSVGLARTNAALQPKFASETKPAAVADNLFTVAKPVDQFVKKAVDEAVQKLRNTNEASEQLENNKYAASQEVNSKVRHFFKL